MNQVIIETENLTKKYGEFTAVDGLNLKIGEGEVFGFLGPNGAGKTTTILMLLGLTQPTSGQAKVCGFNPTREPVKVKTTVGYLPEKVAFYEDLTATENLDYTASLNGIRKAPAAEKIADLLKLVGLSDRANEKVGQFSHGMKQRLGIADVMIKDPKVIFFDEPTSGIDPQGVDEMLKLIDDMAKRNITTVISTHQLHQIQAICTRVGIMAKGKMVADGPISMLGKDTIGEGMFQVEVQASPVNNALIEALKKIEGVSKVDIGEDSIMVSCKSDLRQQISKAVYECGSTIIGLKMEEYNLHDIYLKYFKENQK
jgi:ABC-2 type transport system ATP-binding protein